MCAAGTMPVALKLLSQQSWNTVVSPELLALPLFIRRGGPRFWQATHGRPPHRAADYAPSRIPVVRR